MNYLVLFAAIITAVFILGFFFLIRKLNQLTATICGTYESVMGYEENSAVSEEEMDLFREREEAMAELKKELSAGVFGDRQEKQQNIRQGYPAEVLHPLITNLPEDAVNVMEVYPNVEVAD